MSPDERCRRNQAQAQAQAHAHDPVQVPVFEID